MAHSCKDITQCCLKYTTFLFLLTSILSLQQCKIKLGVSSLCIFTTSYFKYWHPHQLYDYIDVLTVNGAILYNVYVYKLNIITTITILYNAFTFAFLSMNNCAYHGTIHVATLVGCLPWIYLT